ncbi:hypothetical protein ARMSODRAFT_1006846 [Armillaria solidipes]|uniref:F-box domain-containing protein n=1 Tax=Armillaria solidipes TaxID=1076256 RepID=A0A2H3B804_9AGAR|nr:hypothetical protein ARMSODRAFT_1006846 [Armillaria solidipes]
MDTSSRLPLELLLEVFRHYISDRDIPVQSFDFSDGLWTLGQVNRTWRFAVLSDKSLWSTINMAVNYPSHVNSTSSGVSANLIFYDEMPMDEIHTIVPTPTTNQILAYILLRSKDMPLTISLHFPTKNPDMENVISSAWRPLFSVLLAEAHRLRTLDLVAPAQIWRDFANIPLARLPLLQKVDGTLPYIHDFFPVIQRCSDVSDLAVEVRYTDGSRDGGDAIYMPRLCKLEVSTARLLDAITAPNLTSLAVMKKSLITSSSRVPPIVDFIRRSGCSLTNLELHWNGTADELFDVLPSMLTVESLSFFHNSFEVAFDTRMKSVSSVLPRLRAFSLQRDVVVRHREHWVKKLDPFPDAIPVIDVIESMLAGGILESIHVGLVVVDVLSEAARERLSILNATPGVKVEIRQWSSDILAWSLYDRLDSVLDHMPSIRTGWSIHQR